jgi:CDP-6-deoxy-D-xylo-4-hexulose-3-dehydrase
MNKFERKDISSFVNTFYKNNTDKFIPGETPIPVSGKVLGKEEIINMIDASCEGWLTTGRFNSDFEDLLAKKVGAKIAITVNSGSSANLVAFMTLTSEKLGEKAIKKNDEVITVAASFPTTVNPIIQFGAVPVFLDIKLPNFNIDVDLIEAAINKKTKAIMVAHTLGNPFDLKKIKSICEKHNLWLIQDSCDALGALYDNKPLGFYGDLGTLSFYPAHHITMGEGGAIFTNNMKLKRIAESFRDWGRDCYCLPGVDNTCKKRFDWKLGDLPYGYDHKYTYSHMGYNLKITDMQAACGLAQLEKLEGFVKKRRDNFNFLKEKLSVLNEELIFTEETENSSASWFGFLITLKPESKYLRNEIVKYLNQKKIGTRLLFSGNITKQPYMKKNNFRVVGDLKNTDLVMNNSFWIGVYPGLDFEKLDYVSNSIKNFFHK